jgi:hypothetical protein
VTVVGANGASAASKPAAVAAKKEHTDRMMH